MNAPALWNSGSPGGLSATNESTCQALLTGLMLLFSELHSEYPDNIEVMEA